MAHFPIRFVVPGEISAPHPIEQALGERRLPALARPGDEHHLRPQILGDDRLDPAR
jgi:hypothetical protein